MKQCDYCSKRKNGLPLDLQEITLDMIMNSTAQELLEQLKSTILQLKESHFTAKLEVLNGATLGQHVRHTIEFFLCLFDARNQGRLNYDLRKHDPFIEQDPKLAISVIDSIIEFLERETEDFSLKHEANYQLEEGPNVTMESSFFRELSYNIEHTIHHMALIKIGILTNFDYVTLPDHFGVASSTVRPQNRVTGK